MASQLELVQKPFIELQIEALVEENQLSPVERVEKFVEKLQNRLIKLREFNYAKLLDRQFRLPIVGRPNSLDQDYPKHFKFELPAKIEIVGAFRAATAIRTTNLVDLSIAMPAKSLEKRDVKNQRYHHKRALYLAQLAHLLNGSVGVNLIEKLEFRYHLGDLLKPVLIIVPSDMKLKKHQIKFQLFIDLPQEAPLKRVALGPRSGNVTPSWFYENLPTLDKSDEKLESFLADDTYATPTPFYNSSILFDLELVSTSELVREQIANQPSIRDAIILTKIWLYQRDLHSQFSFILTLFATYLQTKQIIHQNMSSYQIFKTIIKSLANSDWCDKGLSYYDDSQEKISSFKSVFPVVFISPSGLHNLCYNITQDMYLRLKHEANSAHNLLTSSSPDLFELLFLKKLDFVDTFDALVHIPKFLKKIPNDMGTLEKYLNYGGFSPLACSESVLNLIKRGLGDRIVLVQQIPAHYLSTKRWSHKGIPYDPINDETTFTVGLLLEPEKSLRVIDVGPKADSPEAEEFRMFWDPKSQLRLQNGVISETVVWHVDSFSQRRNIIKYILTHIFKRINISNFTVHYTLLERFINLDNVHFKWRDENVPDKKLSNDKRKRDDDDDDDDEGQANNEEPGKAIGVGEETFQRVLRSYNELTKALRSVDNMKYSITGIQPMSHHLRASAVFPPLPVRLQLKNKSLKKRRGVTLFPEDFNQAGKILYIEPVEVLMTLESTGKWPNDMEALNAAKLDYLIALGEALKEKEYCVKFAKEYLDILYGQFIFRVRVKSMKEIGFLGAAYGKVEFQKKRQELEVLPRVHAALDQLYREKLAFGLTCRLVKRWLSCHLMTGHISDITIDLIVAYIFLRPQPYTEPASSICGFKRFLILMSTFDWATTPLVVNFDDQLKLDEIAKIKESMSEDRTGLPPMVVCTSFDKQTSPWTRDNPTPAKLDLICRICTKALQFLNNDILLNADSMSECKALFLPNFKMFDLVIKLNTSVVQNFFMSINGPKGFKLSGKELAENSVSGLKVMPIVGFNIVEEYVKVLQSKYEEAATFFFDRYGQRVIGVMLKTGSEKILGKDKNEFVNGIKKLGAKLVESVTLRKHGEICDL